MFQLNWFDLIMMVGASFIFGGLTLGIAIGRFLAKARHRREFWEELG
jgi:hypothetical protein